MPQDSCIISKTQHTSKEEELRNRLYNISQKRQKELRAKEKEEDNKFEISADNFKNMRDTQSIFKAAKNYQTQLSNQTDMKMGKFIDEMRSEFSSTSNKQGIPQHILYQHTRMLERQVNLLENSQKALTEVLNNNMNGSNSNGYSLKQEIQQENRMMMLDIIAPLNQRCMEMKHLHESTRACADGMAGKMEDLKNIIASSHSMNAPMLSSTIQSAPVDPLSQAVSNPEYFTKNLENIKTQMEEIKNQSIAIEHDMENRYKNMTIDNLQKKYMPKTITQEMEDARERQKRNPELEEILTDYDKTRKAVNEKLGGEFDYGEFQLDLKDILAEKDKILTDFRKTALEIPPPPPIGVKKYNFKTRPLKPKPKPLPQKQKIKVPGPEIPNKDIESHKVKPTPSMPVGSSKPSRNKPSNERNPRRGRDQVHVSDYPSPGRNIHLEEEMREKNPVEPTTDLLTLKKQIVEEVDNDLKRNTAKGKYIDPFRRVNNLDNDMGVIETVGVAQPGSEESKMRTLDRELHRRDIGERVAARNTQDSQPDQDKVLDAITDLILEEYLKHHNESKDYASMTEEEKKEQREKENISSFMASLNKNQMFEQPIDPTINDIGEEVIQEKLDSIFKEFQKDKKAADRTIKAAERKRNIHELMRSSTSQFDKSKKKINFEIDEESWEESGKEETKVQTKKSKKIKSKSKESNEESPVKSQQMSREVHSTPVASGYGYVQTPSGTMPVAGPMVVGAHPGAQQFIYESAQAQPSFNLGDIQQIVQNTIANEMKKNVNYLEKRNDYQGSAVVQQPEAFQTHKVPTNEMSEEEIKLRAEENELKKGIAINIAPYAQQTLGIDINRPVNAGYTNPFLGGAAPRTGLNNPRLINLDDYELSSESEFVTDDEADKGYNEDFSDLNITSKTNGKNRYDIVRESEEYKQSDPKPSISQISSIEILKDKKQGKIGSKGRSRPKIMDSDLDPEIEAARKKYRKKGKIDITEEDEEDI
ncbi:unnamed protein product [Moneuplotes crassus]|uniref:Uncharacterized protein n=2 Tax=Euplotes crassus TaxID=5936 RepID=A0AAD2D6B7_EUPCR|nr:unnamed protein product [Moneuplotes crassus]